MGSLPTSTFLGEPDDGVEPIQTIVDLCCGCGMASLGLMSAGGFQVAAGLDADYDCTEAFYLNLNPIEDIATFRDCGWSTVEQALTARQGDHRPDVVLTGPPCQDDSRANHGSDKGRGEVKAPSLQVAQALGAEWIVMEMVGTKYVDWCREQGARQLLKLVDCDLGGFTTRKRWFAVWGPRDLEIQAANPRGWGEAFPRWDLDGCLMATEANNTSKRWQYAKQPHEPVGACVGGDRRHVIQWPDGSRERLGPFQEAALSGFPQLQLNNSEWMNSYRNPDGWLWTYGAQNVRAANTMVGNGWPRSFGYAIGRAIRGDS